MNIVLKICISFLLILCFTACDSKTQKAIKVGLCSWPGYEPLFLAAQNGMLPDSVKVVRFSDPDKAYRAFKSGAIDVVGLTTDELIKYADYGSSPKIFLILDISDGADAVVAKPTVKTLPDLKGKRIAVSHGTLGQYMLYRLLEEANITTDDVSVSIIDIVEQPKAYNEDKADVFVTFEPSKGMMIADGAKLLFDSSQMPNEIIDALAADEDTWNNQRDVMMQIKKGWYEALDYINKNPQKAYMIMGGYENISGAEFAESLNGIKYGSKELNDKLLNSPELVESLKKIQKVMLEKKIVHNTVDLELFLGK